MSFHKQGFAQRFNELGDTAEAIYEKVLPIGNSIPFGWRRPKVTMRAMSNKIKNMPDFYAGSGYLVEVMGCGTDLTLKLKVNKYEALKDWNKDQPVTLFCWNSKLREWLFLDWTGIKKSVGIGRKNGTRFFHDGPEYLPIGWSTLKENATLSGEVHE